LHHSPPTRSSRSVERDDDKPLHDKRFTYGLNRERESGSTRGVFTILTK
jgi:hypothetical protein